MTSTEERLQEIRKACKTIHDVIGVIPVLCVQRNLISFETGEEADTRELANAWDDATTLAIEDVGLAADVQIGYGRSHGSCERDLTLDDQLTTSEGLATLFVPDDCDCDFNSHSDNCVEDAIERAIRVVDALRFIESHLEEITDRAEGGAR